MLYNFLLVSAIQCKSAITINTPSTLASLPTPNHPLQVVTECQAELPVLQSSFPLAICFILQCRYVSVTPSIVPPSPTPTVSISPFSVSASLFLPCRQAYQYHSSKFHICVYMLIYDICFPLSEILHSVSQALGHPPY